MSDSIKNTQKQDSEEEGCGKLLLQLILLILAIPLFMGGVFFLLNLLDKAGFGEEVDSTGRLLLLIDSLETSIALYVGIPVIIGTIIYYWIQFYWIQRNND